jgi:hypothetical protein
VKVNSVSVRFMRKNDYPIAVSAAATVPERDMVVRGDYRLRRRKLGIGGESNLREIGHGRAVLAQSSRPWRLTVTGELSQANGRVNNH